MIDPAKCCLFVGPNLKRFKLDLFLRIGREIEARGGSMIHGDFEAVKALPDSAIPIIGCSPELRQTINGWQAKGRQFLYWDRGYCRRIFATWLPRGENGGMYRWHVNHYQMQKLRDVPDDRWRALKTELAPWKKNGRHIVVAQPTPTYARFHEIENWTEKTLDALALVTDRQIVVRGKESKRSLQADLDGAHCLVAHGSNAANEAVILGCPVFVDHTSAAALVGLTNLKRIEAPIYPDRQPWLNSISYCQFSEPELVNGTLWRLIE